MQIIEKIGVIFLAYLIGSIPFGLIFVKLISGKDIRFVESGRTGGTNAVRAAGYGAGILTAVFDALKGAAAVWLSRWLFPQDLWLQIASPLFAILGHNYSLFLLEKTTRGAIHFRGGAGGATCVGGALGLWPPSVIFIVPLAFGIWYGIGYASVTTMSIALISTIVFLIRAMMGLSPWIYVSYGVIAEILLILALLPNIRRLANGTERLIGWRARKER